MNNNYYLQESKEIVKGGLEAFELSFPLTYIKYTSKKIIIWKRSFLISSVCTCFFTNIDTSIPFNLFHRPNNHKQEIRLLGKTDKHKPRDIKNFIKPLAVNSIALNDSLTVLPFL